MTTVPPSAGYAASSIAPSDKSELTIADPAPAQKMGATHLFITAMTYLHTGNGYLTRNPLSLGHLPRRHAVNTGTVSSRPTGTYLAHATGVR